jgi:hypothetical protein
MSASQSRNESKTKSSLFDRAVRASARRRVRATFAAIAIGGAALVPMVAAATPASAAVSNCSSGYNNAKTAWGHCSSGSGRWTLTVQCWGWGANTANGNGPGSIYASCSPSWSHITNIILNTQQ